MVIICIRCVFRVIELEEFKNQGPVTLGSIFFAIICQNINYLKFNLQSSKFLKKLRYFT